MYPLDCVPDEIILTWFSRLREKTISRAIQWTVTQDSISAPLNILYTFRVTKDIPNYLVVISTGPTGMVEFVTVVNKIVRETLFVCVDTFNTDIRKYASALSDWQKTLQVFHRLITE